MEEKTLFIIPVRDEKTSEEKLELIKKYKATWAKDVEISDEDFQCYIFKK